MKILVNDPLDEIGISKLIENGFKVYVKDLNHDQLVKEISNYDAIIVRSRTIVDKEVINHAPNLKVIARAGVGLDNIDVEYAKEKGITVVNAPAAPTESVAELAIGLMLSMLRGIPFGDSELKKGIWAKKQLKGYELYQKILGVIGYGRIGRAVALKAKAFGMEVLVFEVFDKALKLASDDGFKTFGPSKDSLKEMLSECDIITVHVPLTPKTKGIISYEEISIMKDGVYLVNTSRGGVIDERAMLDGLNNGKIRGVALDVYEAEPPTTGTSKLLVEHPKTVCTPHIGANTYEAQRRAALIVADEIINILK